MNKLNFFNKVIPLALWCSLLVLDVQAQKLPEKQLNSIWLSGKSKIDGKADEWNGKLQAYQSSTNINYSLANNDSTLYLIVSVNDEDALSKILNSGLNLKINSGERKGDVGAISITYPYYENNAWTYISIKNKPLIVANSEASIAKADSFMRFNNNKLETYAKSIKVTGVLGIHSIISKYNEEQIKVSARFDNTMNYIYELSVPLRYLRAKINSNSTFSYHVILPGVNIIADFGYTITVGANGRKVISVAPGASSAIPGKKHFDAIASTTDFWGEYTLAKKP